MRRLVLLFMFASVLSAWADGEVDNLLANGGFDDTGFTTNTLYGYDGTEEISQCISLPGWTKKNDDIDNGIVEILQHEGDTDNPQYVRIRHYTHGSWGRITLSSSVNGLVPGESYVLDMYVCHRYVDSKKGSKPDHGFSLKSPSGKTLASANKLSAGAQWEYRQFAFTPDYEEATLELWSQNIIGDGFVSGLHTVSFDQVRIYQGIASAITVDAEDAPAQIYTLQGIPVAVPTAPGIYLIKRGAKVTKFRVN